MSTGVAHPCHLAIPSATGNRFIEVWEDMGGKSLLEGRPAGRLVKLRGVESSKNPQQTGQSSIDLESMIRIRLVPEGLGANNLLNRFEIKAELVRWRDAKVTPLPVTNFAEIAKDPKDTAKSVTLADAQEQVSVVRGLFDATAALLRDFPVAKADVDDPTIHLSNKIIEALDAWKRAQTAFTDAKAALTAAQATLDKLLQQESANATRVRLAKSQLDSTTENLASLQKIGKETPGSKTIAAEIAKAETVQRAADAEATTANAEKAALDPKIAAARAALKTAETEKQSTQQQYDATVEQKAKVDRRFRIVSAEVKGLAKRIQTEKAGVISNLLLTIFGMPQTVVGSLSEQFVTQMEALLAAGDGKEKERDLAREFLMLRTATVWNDFAITRQAIQNLKDGCKYAVPAMAADHAFRLAFDEQLVALKDQLQEGVIDVPANAPEDGDIVNILMTAYGPEQSVGPVGSLKMRIEIRDYRVRTNLSDSLLFVRRHHSFVGRDGVRNDKNFKPVPGVTLATTFHFRDLKWVPKENSGLLDKGHYVDRKSVRRVLGAISPGVGINASLLGFKEATDCFGTKGNQCKAADGPSFQIGVGPVLSLFDGAAQFTYGFNLSLQGRPAYFGVGFSFLQLIEKGSKLAKQGRTSKAYGK